MYIDSNLKIINAYKRKENNNLIKNDKLSTSLSVHIYFFVETMLWIIISFFKTKIMHQIDAINWMLEYLSSNKEAPLLMLPIGQ